MTILTLVRRHAEVSLASQLAGVEVYGLLHNAFGYGYVIAWGVSFYPQLILNWQRKSTVGMSIGFQWYNVLGFTLYLIYTSFTPESTVQDQIFAAHALVLTICTLSQVPLYGVNKLGDFPTVHGKVVGTLLLFLDFAVILNLAKIITVMDLLYSCGYLKDAVSLVKYTPQLYLNWQRKSTAGFAMGMVFLDLAGGTLSIMQQFIDCKYDPLTSSVRPDWSWEPFSGNKPKLLLGLIAIVYDCLFLYQRFVLYIPSCPCTLLQPDAAVAANRRRDGGQVQRPTLESTTEQTTAENLQGAGRDEPTVHAT